MSYISTQAGSTRFPELDGMRAVAVVSVILYHCEITGVFNAGYFGVDIFFTISGFIITAILLKEFRQSGTISFSAFYFRRLKRLLPPVLALVALAYPVTALLSSDAFAWFKADLPAALSYLSNVWQIHAEQSYFDTTPHVLKHFWSLAVEEQFYILWPLPAWLLMRRGGARATGALAFLLALASTAWMWLMFEQSIDGLGQSRMYLGTDTHAMGLLAGATLACCWNPWAPAALSARARHGWRVAALLALALLGYMIQVLNFADPAMYRGCFLLVPLLTCVILYSTMSDPRFFLSWLLRTGLFQWLGKRSYSLYLVHWPVFVWMRLLDYKDFADPTILATGLAVVLVLSAMLYYCVEAPTTAFHPHFGRGLMASASAACTVAACTWFALSTSAWDREQTARLAAAKASAATVAAAEVAAADQLAAAARAAATAGPALATATAAISSGVPDAAIDSGEKISGGEDIYAIGDSVLLGSSAYISKTIPGIRIDAAVGRQASNGLKVIQEWVGKPHQASTVIVHLGTNGYINEGQFKELLRTLAELPHVIVINVHADRRWTEPNNEIIARMTHEFPNVALIDWHGVSAQRPDYFVKDGIHLTRKGILAMTAQIKLATGGKVIEADPLPLPATTAGNTVLADANHARKAKNAKAAPKRALTAPAAAPVPARDTLPDPGPLLAAHQPGADKPVEAGSASAAPPGDGSAPARSTIKECHDDCPA